VTTDHAETVLSGILAGERRDRLAQAISQLSEEHFQDTALRVIWNFIVRYYDITAAVVTADAFADLLGRSQADEAKVLHLTERFKRLDTQIPDHAFKYGILALRDTRAHVVTGETIATAMEILTSGKEVNRRELQGHEDAREYLYSSLADIDRLDKADIAPEGNIRTEAREIMDDYAKRKEGQGRTGVRTGLPAIDLTTNGLENGELILIAAYTGEGKSHLCTQIAWDVCVNQGKNVFFSTAETQRTQVRRRLIARHSRLPKFGLPRGLDSKDLRQGTLSPEHESVLQAVIEDFTTNPTYGRVHLAQVPRGATLSFVEARLNRAQQSHEYHLHVMDYLTLLTADVRRASSREELNDILRNGKMSAVGFADGTGIPLVSPWAMSQTAMKAAQLAGGYGLASLSDTSEAEKSADTIIALLRLPDTPNEIRLQFLKARDAEVPPASSLQVDYRNSFIAPKDTASAVSGLLGEEDEEASDLLGLNL
jgi:replicative DNA helicase